jgi:hypothetical protein
MFEDPEGLRIRKFENDPLFYGTDSLGNPQLLRIRNPQIRVGPTAAEVRGIFRVQEAIIRLRTDRSLKGFLQKEPSHDKSAPRKHNSSQKGKNARWRYKQRQRLNKKRN